MLAFEAELAAFPRSLIAAIWTALDERPMTRWPGLGYRRMNEQVLHVYTECPEGKIIAIAKRDSVATNDPEAMKGLEWCPWCAGQDRTDNPR
jgi:hypothetical protein